MYKKCFKVVQQNQAIAAIVVLLSYPLYIARGIKYESASLPGVGTALLHFAGFALFEEASFYYSHRYILLFNVPQKTLIGSCLFWGDKLKDIFVSYQLQAT